MEKKNVGKKKTIYIILTAFIVFGAVICAFALPHKATLDTETASYVEKQIIAQESPTAYHEANDFSAVSYKVLSAKRKGDTTEIYMVALYENFVYKNGLSEISGSSGPLVLTVQKTDSGYNLKEYWTPSMGSDYSRSIKERFPLTLQYNAIGSSKYADELKKENLLKASEHFGVSVDDLATAPQGEIMSTTAVNAAGS